MKTTVLTRTGSQWDADKVEEYLHKKFPHLAKQITTQVEGKFCVLVVCFAEVSVQLQTAAEVAKEIFEWQAR